MSSQNIALCNHTAGLGTDVYARVFNSAGDVLDFADNTFKGTLAAATTPYKKAVEHPAMGDNGNTRSSYIVTLDPADFWNRDGAWFYFFWYVNSVPAITDAAVAPLPGGPIAEPGFSQWVEWGEFGKGLVEVMAEMNVKSVDGDDAQVSLWLERNGRRCDLDSTHVTTLTGSAYVREHEAGAEKFDLSFTDADLFNNILQKTQSTPAFVDDRGYEIDSTIVVNGFTYQTTHTRVVIG